MLDIALRHTTAPPGFAAMSPTGLLEWHEVEALARADGMRWSARRIGAAR